MDSLLGLVQPEHFFLGKEKIHTNGVKLMSPTLSNNGLKLAVGKRYKFCAVGIDQTTNDKTGTPVRLGWFGARTERKPEKVGRVWAIASLYEKQRKSEKRS